MKNECDAGWSAPFGSRGRFASTIFHLLIYSLIIGGLHSRASAAERLRNEVASDGISLDEFRICAITWRYDEINGQLVLPEPGNLIKKVRARLRDGYATVRLQATFHGLRVSELTVPAAANAWPQYRILIKANASKVVDTLRLAWGAEFDETGSDGMDGSVLINYRMRSDSRRVRVSSQSPTSQIAVVECNPPKITNKE